MKSALRINSLCLLLAVFISSSSLATGEQHRRPPPEAFEACENQSFDAACTVNTPLGELSGVCVTPPNQDQLVCRPDKMKKREKQNYDDQNTNLNSTSMGTKKRNARPAREHTITQTIASLTTTPATTSPIANTFVNISSSGNQQHIQSNAIAEHLTGAFPNAENPNKISEQAYKYRTPTNPIYQAESQSKPAYGYVFGIAINGVPFDPGAAEWYLGVRSSQWQYAALSDAIH